MKYFTEIKEYLTDLAKNAYPLPHHVQEVSQDAEARVTEFESAMNRIETTESTTMSEFAADIRQNLNSYY